MTRNFGISPRPFREPRAWPVLLVAAAWLTFVFGGAVLLGWLP